VFDRLTTGGSDPHFQQVDLLLRSVRSTSETIPSVVFARSSGTTRNAAAAIRRSAGFAKPATYARILRIMVDYRRMMMRSLIRPRENSRPLIKEAEVTG